MKTTPAYLERRLESMGGTFMREFHEVIHIAQCQAVQDTLEVVLKGLKSETDSTQLRAIIATVEAIEVDDVLKQQL